MFDREHIEAYQRIKAPDGIKDKLLSNEDKKVKSGFDFSRLRSYAACLVMVFIAGFIIYTSYAPDINMNTAELSGDTMLLPNDRTIEAMTRSILVEAGYHMQLDAKDGTDIAISCGELHVWDPETGELLFSGREYSAKKTVAVNIDLEENEKAILSVDGPFCHKKINVEYAD